MLITFITVNKNSGKLLEKTANSLVPHLKNNCDYSWLIIDSNSVDDSNIFIKKLLNDMDQLPIKIIIENDEGIYNAMNKAIKICQSKYLLFINSGDILNYSSLYKILDFIKFNNSYSIICGYRIQQKSSYIKNIIRKIINELEIFFDFCLPSSHNSILYLTEVVKSFPFNEKYTCASDYNQYLELINFNHQFSNKKTFKILNISNDGFIAKRKLKSYQEYIKINYKSGRILGTIYWKLKLTLLNIFSD